MLRPGPIKGTHLSGPDASSDPRSRSPYVIKACEECRRRKIRCNGNQPCRRCDRLSLVCFYRAKRQHNSHPEQNLDVQAILAELNSLRADYEALASSSGQVSTSSASPPPTSQPYAAWGSQGSARSPKDADPLLEIKSEERRRLLYVYDEHIQFVYPLADMDAVEHSAALLDQNPDALSRDQILDEADAACLRLVLANAMAVDEHGHGDLPTRLYESAQTYLWRLADADRLDVRALRAFVLVVSPWITTFVTLHFSQPAFRRSSISCTTDLSLPGATLALLFVPRKSLGSTYSATSKGCIRPFASVCRFSSFTGRSISWITVGVCTWALALPCATSIQSTVLSCR